MSHPRRNDLAIHESVTKADCKGATTLDRARADVYTNPMPDLESQIRALLPASAVFTGAAIVDDYTHDEALTAEPVTPIAVVKPASTADAGSNARI